MNKVNKDKLLKKPSKKKKGKNSIEIRAKNNKKRLLKALIEKLGIVTDACNEAKITRKTFYSYYKADKKFKEEVDDINEIVLDFTEGKLHELVDEKEPSAIYFKLKCKGKERGYIEKTAMEVRHTGIPQKMVIGGQEIDFS